jgi:hypothetical protein
MIESGHAFAVMGNHELNALAYHIQNSDAPGDYLRGHSDKKKHQHHATVEQFTPPELQSALAWFRTLPLWLDHDGFRVVHTCWDSAAIAAIADGLRPHGGVTIVF